MFKVQRSFLKDTYVFFDNFWYEHIRYIYFICSFWKIGTDLRVDEPTVYSFPFNIQRTKCQNCDDPNCASWMCTNNVHIRLQKPIKKIYEQIRNGGCNITKISKKKKTSRLHFGVWQNDMKNILEIQRKTLNS